MDFRYTVIDFDGKEDHYDHIQSLQNVTQFKYGMEVCVVQNENTMDFWRLAPVKQADRSKTDYDAAFESLARYYFDAYGWDLNKMNYHTFSVGL